MKQVVSKKEFEIAEKRMNDLLAIATKKGGFDHLTIKESAELNTYTQTVKTFEDTHYTIPLPQMVQGLIELKML